jgi:membrane protein insertase, YidC/Oxa1 family, N-terminal domain
LAQSTSTPVSPEENLSTESSDPILSDQARFDAYRMQVGAFAYTQSTDSVIEVQTDRFSAKFSTRGAELSELILQDHQDYEGNQVRLIDADFSDFGLNFRTRDNRLIDTSELLFTADQEVLGSETKIIFRAAIDTQSFLEYTYTFKDSSYLIDLAIRTQNLNSYIAGSDPVNLKWVYWAARNDQSVEYENRYTRLTYSYDTGTVKKLSATSDSDEEVAQNVDWVSNRHHFFSAILGSKRPFSQVLMRSENLVEEESKAIKHTKKYTTEAPLTLIGGEINESLYLYMGPTDATSMAAHKDLGIIESIPFGWGILEL